jgi:hypothetical protein
MFCLRTFCPSGRFVPLDVLSPGTFRLPDVLSRRTFWLPSPIFRKITQAHDLQLLKKSARWVIKLLHEAKKEQLRTWKAIIAMIAVASWPSWTKLGRGEEWVGWPHPTQEASQKEQEGGENCMAADFAEAFGGMISAMWEVFCEDLRRPYWEKYKYKMAKL